MSAAHLPGYDESDINRGPLILEVAVSVTILALASVCARMWVRTRMIQNIGPDDYVILLAMLISLVGIGIVIPEVLNGAGRHIVYVDPNRVKLGLKLNFITQPLYLWAITIVKCSIALFLLRIAPTKIYKRVLWGFIIFLTVYTFAAFLTIVLQCENLAVIWDSTVQSVCWPPTTIRYLGYANSSINIATDLLLAFLPIPMLWKVQINSRVKASLICIMGLGIFTCVALMMKLSTLPNYGKTGDFLWDRTSITIWTIVECNVDITTAYLPCLKPLFKRVLDKSWAYSSSKGRTRKGSNNYQLGSVPPGARYAGTVSRITASTNNKFRTLSSGKPRNVEDNISQESVSQESMIQKTTVVTIEHETGESRVDFETKQSLQMNTRNGFAGRYGPERRIDDRF